MSADGTRRMVAAVLASAVLASFAGCAKSTQSAASHSLTGKKAGKASAKKARPVKADDLADYIRKVMKLSEESSVERPSATPQADLLDNDPAIYERKRGLSIDPQNISLRMQLAASYAGYGIYDLALDEYRKIQALSPDNPHVYEAMGRLWRRWGAPGAAVADLQKAIALKPDFADAYNSLGMVFDGMGDYAQAENAYRAAIRIDPNLDYVHNNLCYNFILQKKLQKALDQCDLALQLNPFSSTALNNRGFILAMTGEYEKALDAFTRATDPAGAHNNLGLIYLEKKMFDEALTSFQKAGQLRPAYERATENYDRTLRLRAGYPSDETVKWLPAQVEMAQSRPAVTVEPAGSAGKMSLTTHAGRAAVAKSAPPEIVTQIIDFTRDGDAALSYLSQGASPAVPVTSAGYTGTAPLQPVSVASLAPAVIPTPAETKAAQNKPSFQMIVFPPTAPASVVPPETAVANARVLPSAHPFADPKLSLPKPKEPVPFVEVRPLVSGEAQGYEPVSTVRKTPMAWSRLKAEAQQLRSLSPVAMEMGAAPITVSRMPAILTPPGHHQAFPSLRMPYIRSLIPTLSEARPAVISSAEATITSASLSVVKEGITFERVFAPALRRPVLVAEAAEAQAPAVNGPKAVAPTGTARASVTATASPRAPGSTVRAGSGGIDISLPLLMVAMALIILIAGLIIPKRWVTRSRASG